MMKRASVTAVVLFVLGHPGRAESPEAERNALFAHGASKARLCLDFGEHSTEYRATKFHNYAGCVNRAYADTRYLSDA